MQISHDFVAKNLALVVSS